MLSAANVDLVFRDCLYTNEEVLAAEPARPEGMVEVNGIFGTYGFHPERLESHRAEVREMLRELPTDYDSKRFDRFPHLNVNSGTGLTFSSRADFGTMEQLLCLAHGLGLRRLSAVRALSSALWRDTVRCVLIADPQTGKPNE